MTQNQVAYRNMLIAEENAASNRLQAKASMMQAEATQKREKRSFWESIAEGITSAVSNIGGLLFGFSSDSKGGK